MKEEIVKITLKSKDPKYTFTAKVPIWKAYIILADIEKEKLEKGKKVKKVS